MVIWLGLADVTNCVLLVNMDVLLELGIWDDNALVVLSTSCSENIIEGMLLGGAILTVEDDDVIPGVDNAALGTDTIVLGAENLALGNNVVLGNIGIEGDDASVDMDVTTVEDASLGAEDACIWSTFMGVDDPAVPAVIRLFEDGCNEENTCNTC